MPNRKPHAGVPKLEAFDRIIYQNLTVSGLSARVYSAYFGSPKRIIDAFDLLYCRGKEKKPSTGRISNATHLLLKANCLDLFKIEKSNWPLLLANLEPLYFLFEEKKIRLLDRDKKTLQKALIGTPELSSRFGITTEEAQGQEEFIPSPLKMKTYLNSAATMALVDLFKQQAPDFKEERALLRRIKQKTQGIEDKQGGGAQSDIGDIANFSSDLALNTRVSIKEGEDASGILLFKILRLMHDLSQSSVIEAESFALFE